MAEWYRYTPEGGVTSKRLKLTANAATDIDIQNTFNNEGQRLTLKYPFVANGPGAGLTGGEVVTTAYDNMARPTSVSGTINGGYGGIGYDALGRDNSYSYNALGQITRAGLFQYNYSATQNNGQIQSMQEMNGSQQVIETISYQYDALNRLISATATNTTTPAMNYSETYAYDGWGNRTQQHATRGGNYLTNDYAYDAQTNRILGDLRHQYDGNGNDLFQGAGFDHDNRVVQMSWATQYPAPVEQYAYAPDNKRIYKKANNNAVTEEYYFLDTNGKKLAVLAWYVAGATNGYYEISKPSVYVGSKKVWDSGKAVGLDRLGSVISRSNGEQPRYYPYGEERTATSNDWVKFATYHRDSTGVDYADQRYYASGTGRFLSADPYLASGGASEPSSWNRYAYVRNDPAGRVDPTGLQDEDPTFSTTVYGTGDGSSEWTYCVWNGMPISDPLYCQFLNLMGPIGGPGSAGTESGQGSSGKYKTNFRQAVDGLNDARLKIETSWKPSEECQTDIDRLTAASRGKITAASIVHAVTYMNFFDATTSMEKMTYVNPAYVTVPAWKNMAIMSYFAANLGTTAISQINGSAVYIRPTAINQYDLQWNAALLLHESLHNLSMVDEDIQAALKLQVTRASVNITMQLSLDCVSGLQ